MGTINTALNSIVWLIGLGPDETARVNVVSLGGPDTLPWRGRASFFDGAGNPVKQSDLNIGPGRSALSEVGFQEVENVPADSKAPRKTIRLELVGFNPQPDPPGLLANVDVFVTQTAATRFIGDPQVFPASPR
jgi:hypothetical protein